MQQQVEEKSFESGKKEWADYKHVVWHQAFYELLGSLMQHAKHGCNVRCGDDVIRWLFPIILILLADFEEQ